MNVNMLRTIKLFKDLNEEERSKVVRSFVVRSYAPGQTIINEGKYMYVYMYVYVVVISIIYKCICLYLYTTYTIYIYKVNIIILYI